MRFSSPKIYISPPLQSCAASGCARSRMGGSSPAQWRGQAAAAGDAGKTSICAHSAQQLRLFFPPGGERGGRAPESAFRDIDSHCSTVSERKAEGAAERHVPDATRPSRSPHAVHTECAQTTHCKYIKQPNKTLLYVCYHIMAVGAAEPCRAAPRQGTHANARRTRRTPPD